MSTRAMFAQRTVDLLQEVLATLGDEGMSADIRVELGDELVLRVSTLTNEPGRLEKLIRLSGRNGSPFGQVVLAELPTGGVAMEWRAPLPRPT